MRFDKIKITCVQDLCGAVEEAGFLPFFRNAIEGFSVEECVPRELWFTDLPGPWEWKGPVIRGIGCAYGKFIRGRACYIKKELFPDFANMRRDGYDYDSRIDEGIARSRDIPIMKALWGEPRVLSKDLKKLCPSAGKGAFDSLITSLQMQCYVTISDFVYQRDKNDREFGFGLAEYSTPESFFGEYFTSTVYKKTPERSAAFLMDRLSALLPRASEKQLKAFLL